MLKCRWCSTTFPAEFDNLLWWHARSVHNLEWRQLVPTLRNIEGKLAALETTANTLSRGWQVDTPVERHKHKAHNETYTVYDLEEEAVVEG